MKFKLNTKLLVFVLATTSIVYIISIGYIGRRSKEMAIENAQKMADSYAGKYGNIVKTYLIEDMGTCKAMAESFQSINSYSQQEKLNFTSNLIQEVFNRQQNYRAVWMSWSLNALSPTWNQPYGRVRLNFFNNYGKAFNKIDSMDLEGEDVTGLYYQIKQNKVDVITNPYFDTYEGKRELVASICAPSIHKGKFTGLAGLDISLEKFQEMIINIKPFKNSIAFLVANDGTFVANHKKELVGTKIQDFITDDEFDYSKLLAKGKEFSYIMKEFENGEDYYVAFSPIHISSENKPWMVGIAIPYSEILKESENTFYISLFVGFFGLIILTIIIVIISRTITLPLSRVTKTLNFIAKGEINKTNTVSISSKDEIGEIAESTNTLIGSLRNTADFASQIGMGNLDATFELASEDDVLGNALLNMRTSLRKAKEEEDKMRTEEEKQKWATAGFASFSEILRHNTADMETFTFNIISNLVKYTNSNQGAIFLLNDTDENDIYLEMSSCYAYDRKKYVNKRINFGENLVGQCVQEGETIFMTDIPNDYIEITSGLGGANPRALIIVPLKFNDSIYGVIELASFSNYEDYQRSFIEKIGESIASTVSTVKINLRTVKLLEESKLKSEELAAQEEEMRQNMEELQTTQEESARREMEMNGILNALNQSYLVAELDLDGNILSINDNGLAHLGMSKDFAEGMNIRTIMTETEIEEFDTMWNKILQGHGIKQDKEFMRNGRTTWVSESYTPIYDANDEIYKVLNIGMEIKK